jgi:hypothetical protein
MEALFRTVDRPLLPREGEGVEILEELVNRGVAKR